MYFWLVIFLLAPGALEASCLDNDDPSYIRAVNRGNYDEAFKRVAQELRLTPSDEHHFRIIQGYSRTHDDRNGQADPDTLELRLDPGLFLEGKEGACQGVAHELEHLKQFEKDRRALQAFYSRHAPSRNGWNQCDRENLVSQDHQKAEDDAYDCLQDNDLITHAASDDIEAVLAQVPYAAEHKLRDDDLDYLLEKLNAWKDNVAMIQDPSNSSYYLPEIKRRDTRLFCRGVLYIRQRRLNIDLFDKVWQRHCRFNPNY